MLTIKLHQILYIIAKVDKRFKIHFQVSIVCYLSFFYLTLLIPNTHYLGVSIFYSYLTY